ncbi:MAG: MlaD family protein [Sulfuritalea sp.]|jgi:phospholipid/cholesterol/gamma-HCH transport system substrate-binding protein|nr:MlaD family protein [Sulfuritalea sp.]
METDKHYFFEGLFIIVFSVAAAIFAVWLGSAGRHDDVIYRIHFPDSVSGLTAGDTVKFRGVDVGTVKSMRIDPDNSRLVRVDIRLRKETPVKTDTKASLTLKGITGVVFIELNGGDPAAQTLLAVTPENQIPEIPSEKTGLNAMLDDLPKLVKKFSAIEDQVKKVVTSVGGLTDKVTENPSLLLRRPAAKP